MRLIPTMTPLWKGSSLYLTSLETTGASIDRIPKQNSNETHQHSAQTDWSWRKVDKVLRHIARKQRQIESSLEFHGKSMDDLRGAAGDLQNASMRKFDAVLLTTDRSLGVAGGTGECFFFWLWKCLQSPLGSFYLRGMRIKQVISAGI